MSGLISGVIDEGTARVLTHRYGRAGGERVARVPLVTGAHRYVVDDVAVGVGAARARARVPAPLPHARLLAGAVRAQHALGPAVGRGADVVREARAGRHAAD